LTVGMGEFCGGGRIQKVMLWDDPRGAKVRLGSAVRCAAGKKRRALSPSLFALVFFLLLR
jgi:hypothetical protein